MAEGRWIKAKGKSRVWYCSECGDRIMYDQNRRTYNIPKVTVSEKNRFCRNCGARMEGESNDVDGKRLS